MLGLDKDLYSRTTIYIPGLDNIRKTRCVLSLINVVNPLLQATCYFTFNKSSITDLYTYFSRERKSRKVSTCYRSKSAFGDLETFVTGELKSRAKSTIN
jgi:hypothetical protein